MKTKIIFLLFFLALGSIFTYGQERENRSPRFNLEEFKEKRSEFLKKEIGLTPEEAKVFIPLSNELIRKKFELNRNIIRKNRSLTKKTTIQNAEYEEIIAETFEVRLKEIQLEQEYYEKFKAILSPEKIYKYQQAEMKLARNMVNNRERPSGRDANRRPGRKK